MKRIIILLVLGIVFPLMACGQQTETQQFTIEVTPAPLMIMTSSPLPPAQLNVSYTITMTAMGGTAPYTWDVPPSSPGPLPPGLTLGGTSGTIAGTPSATGSFSFELRVTDASGSTAIQRFEMGEGKRRRVKAG